MLIAALLLTGLLASALPAPTRADDLPEKAILSGVPAHPQTYALSCESRAAADWAGYWGVSISETEFLYRLPSSDNPDAGFVGSAYDPWGMIPPYSYGVHAGPVAEVLRQYGLDAHAKSGLTWDDLRAEIAGGSPVIVWIIGAMWGGTPVEYTAESGDTVIVARYEHTMILYGYDQWSAYVIDSYSGAYQMYPIATFLNSWEVLGNSAVVAGENTGFTTQGDEPQTPLESLPDEYIVQPGDHLSSIARKFGLTWQDLAALNDLTYPYTLYAGNKLKLPAAPTGSPDQPPAETSENYQIFLPAIGKPLPPPPPEPPAQPASNPAPASYTVRQGDFLIQIARTYDLDWKKLAEINGLSWPYTLHPGQVLKLK